MFALSIIISKIFAMEICMALTKSIKIGQCPINNYGTSDLMAIIMLALSVTIFKIFAKGKIQIVAFDLKNLSKLCQLMIWNNYSDNELIDCDITIKKNISCEQEVILVKQIAFNILMCACLYVRACSRAGMRVCMCTSVSTNIENRWTQGRVQM